MVDDGESAPTKRKSAVELMLGMVRDCHVLARQALAQPKPDLAAAKKFMKLARQTGRKAAPYLRDWDLRQRIVSDDPMHLRTVILRILIGDRPLQSKIPSTINSLSSTGHPTQTVTSTGEAGFGTISACRSPILSTRSKS